jgi:hypothetical protein
LRDWHRAFGIALIDLFAGAPWRMELEQELALISQELDVVIIEEVASEGQPRLPDPLPAALRPFVAQFGYALHDILPPRSAP